MTLKDFLALLDRCGADPALWPPGAPAAAARLLETSAEARRAQAALAAAEAALTLTRDRGETVDFVKAAVSWPQAQAQAQALAQAQAQAQNRRPGHGGAVLRRRAALALAASLIVSFGLAAGSFQRPVEDPATVLTAALGVGGESADAE